MPIETYDVNEIKQIVLAAVSDANQPEDLRTDNDRRLMIRAYSRLIGQDPLGNDLQILLEQTGEQRVVNCGYDAAGIEEFFLEDAGQQTNSLYGWNGAALARFLLETNGEQRVSNYGQDEANNMDALRTDPNRILWRREFSGYVDAASAEIPVAEGALWTPGAGAAVRYEVEFLVINNDAGAAAIAGVYVGRDVGGGGALAAPEYWMFNETIPHPGTSGWRGPFRMNGDDVILGVAGVANDASIHFRVRRIDVGA